MRRSAAPPSVPVPGRIHQKVISGRSHLQLIFSAEPEKLDNLKINSLFSSASPPTSSAAVHHVQPGRQIGFAGGRSECE